MYSEFSVHSNYINVPYRLANLYRYDKDGWDLLIFAICLKLNRTDSGMYLRDPKELMKILHCSFRKARRLMRLAVSETRLFRYNPKTKFIVAKSFKADGEECNSMKGKVYKADSCMVCKRDDDGTISHYRISVDLRNLLITKEFRGKAPSDEFRCQKNHSERQRPLTQKYLGNVAGCHQTTVSRRLRRMEKEGKISVIRHEKIPVWDLEHGVVICEIPNRKPFISGRFAYVRDANEYTMLDDDLRARFKHIIYNHLKRNTENRVIFNHWEL